MRPDLGINWLAAGDEAIGHFSELIRRDTSNPPGDVSGAVEYCRGVLEAEGIKATVLEMAPGKQVLAARLKGRGGRGGVVLDAHLDVVPVTGQVWTREPFGGQVVDGFVWGRGSLDMKHMAAMSLQALVLAKRSKLELQGDLALLLTPDEEVGAPGIKWVAQHHPELMEGEFALGEVGGLSMELGGRRIYPVQVAEKGLLWVRILVKGDGGHGSIPVRGGTPEIAAGLVTRLARRTQPIQPNEPVRMFLEEMGRCLGFPASVVLKLIQVPGLGHTLLRRVFPDKKQAAALAALLTNTVNPTVMRSDNSVNVVPGEIILEVDCRLLPGTTPERFLEELKTLVGDLGTIEVLESHMGSMVPWDNPLYHNIKKTVERLDPGSRVVPYMISGFTNGHAYLPLGVRYMGFTPVTMPPGVDWNKLFHAADERCPVDGFRWGVRTLFETLSVHLT